MTANVLFVVMILFSAIALLIAFISSTIAAADLKGSPSYSTNQNIKDAYTDFTIAAILGGSSLAILIVIMIVAAFTGGFNAATISDELLNTDFITPSDLESAYKAEAELSAGHTTQIIIIGFLIIIGIITLIIGIFAIIGSIILANLSNGDSKTNSAYTAGVVASVAGVGGIGLMIVAIITYIVIRNNRTKMLDELDDFTNRGEKQKVTNVLTQPISVSLANNQSHHYSHSSAHVSKPKLTSKYNTSHPSHHPPNNQPVNVKKQPSEPVVNVQSQPSEPIVNVKSQPSEPVVNVKSQPSDSNVNVKSQPSEQVVNVKSQPSDSNVKLEATTSQKVEGNIKPIDIKPQNNDDD